MERDSKEIYNSGRTDKTGVMAGGSHDSDLLLAYFVLGLQSSEGWREEEKSEKDAT